MPPRRLTSRATVLLIASAVLAGIDAHAQRAEEAGGDARHAELDGWTAAGERLALGAHAGHQLVADVARVDRQPGRRVAVIGRVHDEVVDEADDRPVGGHRVATECYGAVRRVSTRREMPCE